MSVPTTMGRSWAGNLFGEKAVVTYMINENARSSRSIADAGNSFALTRQLSNGQEVQIFRIFSNVVRNLPASAILLAVSGALSSAPPFPQFGLP
jgi:hypothetical protein